MLRLAPGLELPDDYVTKTAAIFAQRRKGKTYTAKVIAEELVHAGLPWVALDPTDAWWGLRASADGQKPGLPVIILGGKHADIPITRHDGKAVAELVVEHPGWYVIAFDFESRAAERQFATDFAEALYRLKGKSGKDFPMHMFVDEADMFVPQDKETGDLPMLGAFQAIVRRGGLRGLGTTLISQRPALVNKSVLVQLDILIVLRLVAGNDQDYVKKNYLDRAGAKEQVAAVMESWAKLGLGECWIWEPGEDLFERAQIREGTTFNSSATPKPGEARIEPKRLADVDVAAVKERLAATVERVKSMDPDELNRRIAELERELAIERSRPLDVATVEVVPQAVWDLIEPLRSASMAAADAETAGRSAYKDIDAAVAAIMGLREPQPVRCSTVTVERPVPSIPAAPAAARPSTVGQDEDLAAPLRKILTVLATHGRRTKKQLGMQTGYVTTGGSFNNYLGRLRTLGYIEPQKGEPMDITLTGRVALGEFEPLPTGRALLDHWIDSVGGPPARLLGMIAERWPRSWSKDELAAVAGYEPTGGSFNNYLGRLRTLELIVKGTDIKLTEEFGSAIS